MKTLEIPLVLIAAVAVVVATSVSSLRALTPGLDAEEENSDLIRQQEIFDRAGVHPGFFSGQAVTTGQAGPVESWSDLPGALGQEEISANGLGHRTPLQRLHDELGAHQSGYEKVITQEFAAAEAAKVDPGGLKAADCPNGLCSDAAIAALKNDQGEDSLAVVMASLASAYSAINGFMRYEEEANGHVFAMPTTVVRPAAAEIEARWNEAVGADAAQAKIAASPVLQLVLSRYVQERGAFHQRMRAERP
ncbi:MAG: hypothetical protein HY547_06095 [Elusimicrobia bacterium]|nr:hypothetical protein [Elusimicrobiota bacterium]